MAAILARISTHAPLRGATGTRFAVLQVVLPFLLTPLCEGRLGLLGIDKWDLWEFLLTPLCEGRQTAYEQAQELAAISTHAPLRGATGWPRSTSTMIPISTHAPLRGATVKIRYDKLDAIFLLTPLCEGRHWARPSARPQDQFLLTPLCEGRHPRPCQGVTGSEISTHAPLRGATLDRVHRDAGSAGISTHAPLRGATLPPQRFSPIRVISTHAPLRGATSFRRNLPPPARFLLTPLCEGRRDSRDRAKDPKSISTHAPLRGAT